MAAKERAAVAMNLRRVVSFIAPKGKPVRSGGKTMEITASKVQGQPETLGRRSLLPRRPLLDDHAEVV